MKPAFRVFSIFLSHSALLLILLLLTVPALAQQDTANKISAEEMAVIPAAVLRAPVRVEQVVKGGAENGGDLIIRRIEEPVFTAAELAAMQPAPVKELTAVEKTSRLAAMMKAREKSPLQTRLFSPNIINYPDSVSKVSWWTMDDQKHFEDHEVWVRGADMSLLPAVGDLNVGRRRWLLTAFARQSSEKFSPHQAPPTAADFAAQAGDTGGPIVLVEKGGDDAAALEPLTALLSALTTKAPELTQTLAAMKAEQERQAAEAAATAKLPPAPSVIRFWTSDHDEVGTFSRNAQEAAHK